MVVPFSFLNKKIKTSSENVQELTNKLMSLFHVYQTRETVFPQDIQTLKGELKIQHAAEYF